MASYTISASGWVSGKLPGPFGVLYPVEKNECPRPGGQAYLRLTKTPPDLCIHTTEGTDLDSAIATLKAKFSPSQFAVGENRIAQLRPLWAQGAAVDTQNAYLMQVETVAKSNTKLWLPAPETLNPLVALMAFLHREHIVTTALQRPKSLAGLPHELDVRPSGSNAFPATDRYYRRFLAPLPAEDGVRGHVDLRDDEHWDPGSLDYGRLFPMVWAAVNEEDAMTPEETAKLNEALKLAKESDERWAGFNDRRAGKPEPSAEGPRKNGWRSADEAFSRPKPTGGGGSLPEHKHVPGGVQGVSP